ncbi:MAG: YraN family protein [Planctomycetaceae bacterium]|nr:YraN family protein [Planctomycetaceae bacterium]
MWGWFTRITKVADQRRTLGARGERAAVRHLRRNGYQILARNLRTKLGEIDVIARDRRDRCVVIVEVKTGRGDDPPPEAHVNHHKQRKITMLAKQLIKQHRLENQRVRFDVIAVVWREGDRQPRDLRHHEHAFEAVG